MPHALALSMVALTLALLWLSRGVAGDRDTLDAALILAGLDRADLPITLVETAPPSASPGVEAWTSYDANGSAVRIFVYAGSDMFRCARWPLGMRQCRIRLASALVHEAWHFEHGRNEKEAYETQIAFLMRNGAATEQVKAVRLAQNRVLATARRAADGSQR
jgi:hypothetical protein